MRPVTRIIIIGLFVLIGMAAIFQLVIASSDRPEFPGPSTGTALPGPP